MRPLLLRTLYALLALLVLAGLIAYEVYVQSAAGTIPAAAPLGVSMMQVWKAPFALWLMLLAFVGAYVWSANAEARDAEQAHERTAAEKRKAEEAKRTFAVQLIGAQLISPYVRRGLPLQAQLPALLDHDPYRKPKAKWAPITGGRSFHTFVAPYFDYLLRPFRFPFWALRHDGESFFYNGLKRSRYKNGKFVRETSNHVPAFVTLSERLHPPPEYPHLQPGGYMVKPKHDPEGERVPFEYLHFRGPVGKAGGYVGADFEDGTTWIHYRFGAAPAGFSSLAAAIDHLETHPREVAWLIAADAPGMVDRTSPDEQVNESALLLLLAHPDFDTGRDPLALIHRPVRIEREAVARPAERLKAAFTEALSRAATSPETLGRLVHDAGAGEAGSERLGPLARAATETLPEFDWLEQQVNLPGWLGELGASTTAYNLLAAAWAAHSENRPALVAGVTDPEATHALTVVPPPGHVPPDPNTLYWGARAESEFSRPWWGRRRDGKPDFGMSPMERDDGTPAKPAKPFELEYE